ncbi:MAG: 50S ribosomal protein L25 [bacterium]|nr:50S ribosomal protein L25 [bacterium]
MAQTHSLESEKREVFGRKLKALRRTGVVPANVYGKMTPSTSIQVNLKGFMKVFEEAGETGLVDLKVGKESKPVLIHNVQRNPVTDIPVHVDFLQVDLKQKVTVMVPLEFIGEAVAEKEEIGIVVRQLNEIEVEALPTELPESIEVDLSGLAQVDDAIKVSDLKVDTSKVEVKTDPEQIVAAVVEPAKEEVIEEVAPAEGEEGAVPAEGEEGAASEGGEAPVEGGEEKPKEEASE